MQNDYIVKKDLKSVNDGKVTSNSSSHAVGTTLGLAGGAVAGISGTIVAGAAIGSSVGPAGAALGAAVGGVIGAMTGHDIAAQINPKEEDLYWRANYKERTYIKAGKNYTAYQPAYMYGINSFLANRGKSFEEIESELGEKWGAVRGTSSLDWNDAKHASRDAYNRLNDQAS